MGGGGSVGATGGRFCMICGTLLIFSENSMGQYRCGNCRIVYQKSDIHSQNGVSGPGDCLDYRLEVLEKKVVELDRAIRRLFDPIG